MKNKQFGGKPIFYYDKMLDRSSNTVRIYQQDDNDNLRLIAKGFYKDDFHLSVTNQWATGDSTIVKQALDAFAGMATGRSAKIVGEMANKAVDVFGVGDKVIHEGSKTTVNDALALIDEGTNAHYFSADDFFKSFKGTTVTFPSNIQISLLSDEWNPDIDIFSKLKSILEVSVGEYKGLGTETYNFVGMQNAPNGFKSGSYNLLDDIEGSLKIVYGDPMKGGYTVNHMLISNVHFTFSKTKVEVRGGVYRPLYIDIQLMLEPAKKFTRSEIYSTLSKDFDSVEPANYEKPKLVPEGASKEESKRLKAESMSIKLDSKPIVPNR